MNIIDIINKKEAKKELSYEEIKFFIDGYVNGEIEDYQMSSLLMAISINSMSEREIFDLTNIMLNSGEKLDLSDIKGIKVDKHSTGGVGDKTSLVVLPLAASAGVKIAKMSGRGLGLTGGTIDKLESIAGFNSNINNEEFKKQVNKIGLALVSQTNNLVPADKKIYALRDVTGTTESIPLIASSIMSKKLASGSDKILLDVKVGKGAFMNDYSDAKKLAELMVKIGKNAGKETIALLTNMDYPLGKTIGNGLEVQEAIETLKGNGEINFLNLCILEASYMLSLSKNIDVEDAIDIIEEKYKDLSGLEKLKEFISYQGGNINNIDICDNKVEVLSTREGYVCDIDTKKLAEITNSLGAGRINKDDNINHGVGIKINKVYGNKVNVGDVLMQILTNDKIDIDKLENIFILSDKKPKELKMIYEIIK